ncbi:MAG TPA: RHS repeat-associated core domain-containing protein [Bacteroidales bacterium]|nr:RHS repeat-associated core domain-containing protein [Bacteroidales bacterium]
MTSDCPTRTCRLQAWDEENRLTTVNDKNKSYLSNYLYDAGGERIIKLSGAIQKIMQQNGDIIEFANLGENISINFGAHMVLNNNRYTKHYYIEGQRICSKLGKGFSAPPVGITQSVTPISGTYTNIAKKVLVMFHRGDYKTGFDTLNTTYPASITIVPNLTLPETDRYFYHSDHLGSSSFISSNAGTTTQHLQYLPFGEPNRPKAVSSRTPLKIKYYCEQCFVEQKSTTAYLSPYRFSGKERDEETGYSYFGARYYNPELSIWLSVDPLASKYPSTSVYMYCLGNPVMLFDPDGREGWPVTRQWSNSDISGFATYSKSKLQEYKDQKIKDDCANFAVRLIVGYASENGLPLSLKNTAGKTFDSSSDEYQSTEQYLNSVRVGINAQDIPLNTYNINQTETQAGDMEVLHYSINEGKDVDFNHVVIFSSSNKITWGNLNSDGSGNELYNTTGNWVRSSSYNDGVNNKFNVFSGIYNSRWKVLNPANMRSNQQMTKISPLKFKEIQIEKTIIE